MFYIKCWLNPDKLHLAVQDGHTATVLKYIRSGYDLNIYNKHGFTPLQYSLLFKRYEIALLLLEAQADPNLICKKDNLSGKTIQPYIRNPNISIVRLLAIYGTTPDGIEFEDEESVMHAFKQGHNIYIMQSQLKKLLISSPRDNQEIERIQQQLCQAFQEVIQAEIETTLHKHYTAMAAKYRNLDEIVQNNMLYHDVEESIAYKNKSSIVNYLRYFAQQKGKVSTERAGDNIPNIPLLYNDQASTYAKKSL
jgi:ankyrin repeat protein